MRLTDLTPVQLFHNHIERTLKAIPVMYGGHVSFENSNDTDPIWVSKYTKWDHPGIAVSLLTNNDAGLAAALGERELRTVAKIFDKHQYDTFTGAGSWKKACDEMDAHLRKAAEHFQKALDRLG